MKQSLPTDFAEYLLTRKEIQIKAWYRIVGTETLSYEEFHCKTKQNENRLDTLACVTMLDEMKDVE